MTYAPAPSRRWLYVLLGAVAAALVVVAVGLFMVLGQLRAQDEERAYQACLERHGVAGAAPNVSDEDADAYLDKLVEIAGICARD